MKFGLFRLSLLPFYDVDPGGAPAAPAAPSAPAPSGGQPSTPAPGAPGQPAAPAAPPQAPAGFTYKEDRSQWVPAHVNRQYVTKAQEYERQLAIAQSRVAALSGIQPPAAPRNPEFDEVRNRLFEVAPERKELFELKDKLKELTGLDLNEIKAIRESQNQSWQVHGNQTLRTLADKAKAAYGGADLPAKTLQRISRAFVAEVAEDPEMKARYEGGDPTVIDDFIKDYTTGVLDPYRRSTAAAAQPPNFLAARRLPRGGGSSAVVGARPATLKPGDAGFHNAAFQRFTSGE